MGPQLLSKREWPEQQALPHFTDKQAHFSSKWQSFIFITYFFTITYPTASLTVPLDVLEDRSANFFCKGTDNKSFWLCGSVSVTTIQLCRCSMKIAIDNIETNEQSCVPIKLYLQMTSGGPDLAHGPRFADPCPRGGFSSP